MWLQGLWNLQALISPKVLVVWYMMVVSYEQTDWTLTLKVRSWPNNTNLMVIFPSHWVSNLVYYLIILSIASIWPWSLILDNYLDHYLIIQILSYFPNIGCRGMSLVHQCNQLLPNSVWHWSRISSPYNLSGYNQQQLYLLSALKHNDHDYSII